MGNTLDKPKTDKDTEVGSSEMNNNHPEDGLSWGVSSMQGWRLSMEDAHICASPNDDDSKLKAKKNNSNTAADTGGDDGGGINATAEPTRLHRQSDGGKETATNQASSKDPNDDKGAIMSKRDKETASGGDDGSDDQEGANKKDEDLRLPPHHYFFCVLDGHGGDFAAHYGEENLLSVLLEQDAFQEYERLWRATTTLSTTTTMASSSSTNAATASKLGSKKRKQAGLPKKKEVNNNSNKWKKNASPGSTNRSNHQKRRQQRDDKLLERQSKLLQGALEDAFVELDLMLLQEMARRKMVLPISPSSSSSVMAPPSPRPMEDDGWGTFDRMEEEEEEEEHFNMNANLSTKSQNVRGDTIPGTTAVAVLVTPDWIICANLGDSRASLLLSSYPSSQQQKIDPVPPSNDQQHTNKNNKKKNNKQKGNKNNKKEDSNQTVDDGNCSKREGDNYWTIVALSEDHKPDLPEEQTRIEAANGCVTMGGRVDGELAVSRALGDFGFKEAYPRHLYSGDSIQKRRSLRRKRRRIQNSRIQGGKSNGVDSNESLDADKDWEHQRLLARQLKVSPFPEVFAYPRGKQSLGRTSEAEGQVGGEEKVLLLGCDGIWDVMTNENCHNLVQELLAEGETNMGLIAEEILDTCLKKGSRDNMTMMVVHFADEKSTSGSINGIDACHSTGGGGVLKRRKQRNSVDRGSKGS